jgi:uncharacterized protein
MENGKGQMVGRLRVAILFAICHLPFAVAPAAAQPPPPQLTATVNDFAGALDEASKTEIDRRIRALHEATGDAVVVATVRTFQPYADIDSYAVRMFENGGRGIGARGKDNGLLIVVAVDDRRARIEVGYDLEQFITDGFAGETIRTTLLPEFRTGNYGAGLLAGTTRVINRIAERRGVTLEEVPRERQVRRPPTVVPGMNGVAVVAFLLLLLFFGRLGGGRRRRRRWGGGPWSGWNSGVGPFGGSSGGFGGGFGGFGGGRRGGGGGFGGFGGGRSGGGGASGGW